MASPEGQSTNSVTLEEVEAITDLKGASRVAKKFNPPVCLKKCKLPQMIDRLKLAVLKSRGEVKDVEALGQVMQDRREEDHASRKRLLRYFTDLTAVLADMDDKLREHVDKQGQLRKEMEQFKHNLADPPDKLIVAGQTSSGKSTLLNIFLGSHDNKDILPTKALSCTATPCELRYGEICSAVKVVRGVEEYVDFDQREEVMYKASSRESRFEHDLVRLRLPCFFLKSGLTLVDTPGIGENYEMSNVLKDYVSQHDVFGFVFTMASSCGGGVLPKFQNLIRDLATPDYVDRFGQRKFDPRSCIFVANFWDQVPDKDKPSSRKHIGETLTAMPSMSSFKPEEQLFFMDSKFACSSKNEGLISDDLSNFIDGLGSFVWKEQRRKLNIYYRIFCICRGLSWLEDKLLHLLHLLRTYIRRMRQTEVNRHKKRDKTFVLLDGLEKLTNNLMKQHSALVESKITECSKLMYAYMVSDNARQKVAEWRYADIPVGEIMDDWVILEYGLDEAIDDRVSDVLHMWETSEQVVSRTEEYLMVKITKDCDVLNKELDQVQRDLRNVGFNVDLENLELHRDAIPDPDSLDSLDTTSDRQFRIKFGKTYGMNIMGANSRLANILDTFVLGPTLKVNKGKKLVESPSDSQEKFRQDKVEYMRQRAMMIYERMCQPDFCKTAMQEQFKTVTDFLKEVKRDILQSIHTNKALLSAICADKRNSRDVQTNYMPLESSVTRLFDEVVEFGCTNVHEASFQPADITFTEQQKSDVIVTGLFSSLMHGKLTWKAAGDEAGSGNGTESKEVTLYLFSGSADPGLKRSEKLFQERHLRKLRYQDLAQLLGTYVYQGSTCLVLNHRLCTARQLLFGDSFMAGMNRKKVRTKYISFLSGLGTALHYLHCNKLVHPELSLDTILVKAHDSNPTPVLCNINEPISIQLAKSGRGQLPVRHYLYLPPEVLSGRNLYTDEADMYGLGLAMMELCYHGDIFTQLKQDTTLDEWMVVKDPGEHLLRQTLVLTKPRKEEEKTTKLWKKIISKCLHQDPSQRISVNRWHNSWMDVIKADWAPGD